MRLGVVDVGSNSARLQIVDAYPGGPPLPTFATKTAVRLAESLSSDGDITVDGVARLVDAVTSAVDAAQGQNVDELIVLATSALRDAPNAEEVRRRVHEAAGVDIRLLSGEDEARLIFLAAHRWLGWSARQLMLIDLGGGSMEIAIGRGERPALAISLPLGAGRLTASHLASDPARHSEVKKLRRHVRTVLREVADRLWWEGRPDRVVATSQTFKQLARLTGAPSDRHGPFVRRTVARDELHRWIPRLEGLTIKKRAKLHGISKGRAHQILAGAIVAEETMAVLDIETADICPWALREGILLRRIDGLLDPAEVRDTNLIEAAVHPLPENSVTPLPRREEQAT